MALPDEPKNQDFPPPLINQLSDTQLLDNFKQDPTVVARDLIKQPDQLRRFWRLLETNFSKDQLLVNAYDKTQNILGKIPPIPQPQTMVTPESGVPPLRTAEELIPPETKGAPKNDLGPENAKGIEKWMNGIKPGFYQWWQEKYQKNQQVLKNINQAYAASQNEAAVYQHQFTHGFLEYLSMYKGGLAGFYLSQGAHEMLFSALGPVGEALAGLHQKDLQWKIAWMKNPLNANALYYWLNVVPEEQAFRLLYLPARAAWAILAHGGAPLISKVTYKDYEYDPHTGPREVTKTGNFFSPTLKLSQAAHALGNALDKITGTRLSHEDFLNSVNLLKKVKTKDEFWQTYRDTKNLLDEHDGFYRYFFDKKRKSLRAVADLPFWERQKFGVKGTLRAISRNALRNGSRRLKSTSRDPISYLAALIIGTIFDLTIGMALNVLRVAAGKVINTIPGVNALRVQTLEFLSRSKLLNSLRIGGTTVGQFGRALISPTSFSSGYVGAGAGGWVANALGLPVLPGQIIGGGIGYGLGAFYKNALNLANMGIFDPYGRLNPVGWTKQYQAFRGADVWRLDEGGKAWSEQMIKDNYMKGWKPGPINKFANWLYDHPYRRLPLNGFVVADLGVKLLGWNPWVAYPSLMFTDWAWQTRATWGKTLARILTQPNWTIFGKEFVNHFSFQNSNAFAFRVRGFFGRAFYVGDAYSSALLERPWLNSLKNVLGKIRPFTQNFINPGFALGFGLVPFLSGFMPTPLAYFVGPVGGSIAWTTGTLMLEKMGIAAIPQLNAWAWSGYMIGSLLEFAFPNFFPPGFGNAMVLITPGVGLVLKAFGLSFSGIFISALSAIGTAIPALSALTGVAIGAIGAWATVMSVALVAGLTIFFAYTIYAGFWVPMIQEEFAQPESSNFSIKGNCTEVSPNKYRCCSNFNVTENIFNAWNYLDHETDLADGSKLTIDLTDPHTHLTASRDSKSLNYRGDLSLTYNTYNSQPSLLNFDEYTIHYVSSVPIINTGATTAFDTYLSTPNKILTNLFDLMSTNSSVVRTRKPFWDILVALAEEEGKTEHLLAEYRAQLKLLEAQQDLVYDLIDKIEKGDLDGAFKIAEAYFKKEPMGGDPCPEGSDCPEEKQQLKDLYDSWQPIVQRYIDRIKIYQGQTDPDLTAFLEQLKKEFETLDQQIEALNQIIGIIEEINLTDQETEDILKFEKDGKFLNFPNLSLEEREAIWKLLEDNFPEVFDRDKEFYFIPASTDYGVCVDVDYCRVLDPANPPVCPAGVPQTICSTVSYSPTALTETAFAKACTTFTPQ